MGDHHRRDEEAIFYSALELTSPTARAAYVKEACGNDTDLLERVRALLMVDGIQDGFLEDPPTILDVPTPSQVLTESPGTVIGRYKLLEKIGEGGMAVVYMAEQEQPIRRKVALKIIKLGMDTRQVIARFEAERQALAMMDHPCIARVLDAGSTETGRPYFVMELVQGVSITEYCDKNNLTTKDRLALFLQVCQAVQHAHTKGIIHRDIKPSNVMVTHHDGKPVPKVIDFGIAKAINQKLTEKTLFTRYAHLIGTPAYMSPEQAELSDLDIDTRTDIYSLGVLLYELLTGTTPFSEEELRKAGYIEMQRVIREQEPVKPSTRIRTATRERQSVGAGPRACPTSGGHGGPPLREVQGDLDWIVMKSLEKDRVRRYETASGLGEDIRRHLEHEPVLARGPGVAYRVERFLRRHRSQVVSALALGAIAAAAAVVFSMWNRDRLQLAEAEGFRHRGILSLARGQYAMGDREAALKTARPILNSRYVGPEAQLLYAGILVEGRQPNEATVILTRLLDDRREIAGAAHSWWARILWEGQSLDAQTLKQVQEHQQKARELMPETAEAYFLQAMSAITVKDQLAWLDRALELDSHHYASRRLRAFIYRASRRYEQLCDDALGMTILRQNDPLGYSLRAIALRELGKYDAAIWHYEKAIALTPQDSPQSADLSIQYCETLLRMGDYKRVVEKARECLARWPDRDVFQYDLFYAFTAGGEYDEAQSVCRQIVGPREESRGRFDRLCTKHVFDSLRAGRMWHPPDRVPAGRAFAAMIEAEDSYRQLSAKGRWLTTDGFNSHWSPDGTKLAFSMGVHGYSGVAIYDPATKETDLLIVPAKDPKWSPDSEYIVFVRDCQVLRIAEFVGAERRHQHRSPTDEEVWVMNSDGTEPRYVARGSGASWGKDSTCVYYYSRLDKTLCSISLTERTAEPQQLFPCSGALPSVSPDGQYVAYKGGGVLGVRDLVSQAVSREWPAPVGASGGPMWSPTGRELCVGGGFHDGNDARGLWIYPFDANEPLCILGGPIVSASWALNGTKLAFTLGSPHFDIWAADLDPNVSTLESLGPGQTREEYSRDGVALCTRRIEADPQDAYAYSDRARYYDYLHDRANANADMRRWSAVMSGRSSSDLSFGTPRVSSPSISRMSHARSSSDLWLDTPHAFRRVLKLPYDCELVFSAERPVNTVPTMSIAFGQKGRCEMKLFEVPMVVTFLVGLGFFTGPGAPPARADFTFGEPVDLQSTFQDVIACFSADGLEIYIISDRAGGQGKTDIWVCKRASPEDDWGSPENLGPVVNSAKNEDNASITGDGLELYFYSDRPGGYSAYNIYVTRRATPDSPWGPSTLLGPNVNSSSITCDPSVTADGLELYFTYWGLPGGYGQGDFYVSRRATTQDPWGPAADLGPAVNSPANERFVCVSVDGLLLLFHCDRPGGYGNCDIWMTKRLSRSVPWEPPVNLGPKINGPLNDFVSCLAPDGSALYFHRSTGNAAGTPWMAPIIRIVDFNGDGNVDLVDLVMLIDNWGTDNTLYDIGPYAWGDGKVDIEDLKVFVAEWEKAMEAESQAAE